MKGMTKYNYHECLYMYMNPNINFEEIEQKIRVRHPENTIPSGAYGRTEFYYQNRFTVAIIVGKGGGIASVGVSRCHMNDRYQRIIGDVIAFSRALHNGDVN